jgi:hypothetical protein
MGEMSVDRERAVHRETTEGTARAMNTDKPVAKERAVVDE